MTTFEAILLGIIQGITEFLPISSTGHLTLTGRLLGLVKDPEQWTAFIAIMQLGTLLSILIYFVKDILVIIEAFFKENLINRKGIKEQSLNSRLGWMIILGTIPIVIVGLFFKDAIEGPWTKNLYVIASSLILVAIILGIAEKTANHAKEMKDVSFIDALIIGIAQVFALIPGSSRSGTTLIGGLFSGLTRETAARFSFLLSIPAIFASGVLEIFEFADFISKAVLFDLIVATIVSAVSGYLAIDFLLKFLKKRTTFVFIYYRILLGLVILTLLHFNVINP